VRRALAITVPVAVLAVLNLGLLAFAAADRSWVAVGVALIYGPLANLIAATILFFWSCRVGTLGGTRAGRAGLLLLLACAAIVVDFLVVGSLGLHGC